MSQLELLFIAQAEGRIPLPVRQYRFHPERRWQLDFAWIEQKVALEVEGGIWIGGRHVNPVDFEKDMEKYNAAALAGWRLFRVSGAMVEDGRAVDLMERVLVQLLLPPSDIRYDRPL